MWVIFGGSGFEKFDDFEVIEEIRVDTPFGAPSAPFLKVKIAGTQALFLSRHGKHHEFSPSHINYRANIFAAKQCGGSKILSISAVGSLRKELKPGDCVIPSQYIDRTKSIREHTFCAPGIVGHVSCAHPVDLTMLAMAKDLLATANTMIHFDKTYVCIEGPNFSTKAESHLYRQWNADIIGMSNYPEYLLAREAGLYYFPFAFVTDYDSWDDTTDHVTLEQVLAVMRLNNHKAFSLMKTWIPATNHLFQGCAEQGLKTGLMCSFEGLAPEIQAWMKILRQDCEPFLPSSKIKEYS